MRDHAPILPGATLGVLGGGQLGRMFAMAARRLGYRVRVLSPDDDTPTGQIADVEVRAAYDDADALARFAREVDVVTFEFENVPALAAEVAARHAPVRPRGEILLTTQNRVREKAFLSGIGIPIAPFRVVRGSADVRQAAATLGCPAVLKSADWGYDGHGQVRVRSADEAVAAWQSLAAPESVLETMIDFQCELSVVAARGLDGRSVYYGPMRNAHRNHILDVAVAPADLPEGLRAQALEMARTIVDRLDLVGVLCVEFFLTRDEKLMVNELAPRPHNSGHLTIDAHVTCQFEQQVRAVCGLPLGSVEQRSPAAMANLLGDLWKSGAPKWDRLLGRPGVRLHLYGKAEPRPGRKMGHVTALAADPIAAEQLARAARESLTTP